MGGGGLEARVNRPFNEDYRCYSMAMLPGARRENVDYGGKGTHNSEVKWLMDQLFCLRLHSTN